MEFHPALFTLAPEHRRTLTAELEQYLAHHPGTAGERIPLHQGRYVASRLEDADGPPRWQIRPGQSAEATSRANLTTAIETWLDLAPSTADLTLIVEAISALLARQQRATRQEGRP